MAELSAVVEYANELLKINQFKDYCPNGLQVEGRSQVKKIVSGVTACQALIDEAIQEQADLLLVHHGYFWRGEDASITGIKQRRIKVLLNNGVSLLAYHLPLDAHPELGNNANLAVKLGFQIEGVLTSELIGNYGSLAQVVDVEGLAARISIALEREPLVIPAGPEKIKRVGWCTGAAQNYIDQAISLGLDAYISGEISEQTVHQARESGIHYFAAGHHATERYGVQSLGERLAQQFDISHQYIDIDNPV